MKYLSLLFISISLLSCKEDIVVSPPPLIGTTWFLVESRGKEFGPYASLSQDFKWQKFKRIDDNSLGYEFKKDTITEIDYPGPLAYRAPFYRKVAYLREDSTLKVNRTNYLFVIFGNNENKMLRLTKDTLVIGSTSIGRDGGSYNEFKLVRAK